MYLFYKSDHSLIDDNLSFVGDGGMSNPIWESSLDAIAPGTYFLEIVRKLVRQSVTMCIGR